MARILLVHGAAHGAWCWRHVVPALQRRGHAVHAIDLPSHGLDATPAAEVGLETYIQAILGALPEPAMVVAHSMAGVPAAGAADRAPERVTRLVYLCAYRPGPGDSVASLRRAPGAAAAAARRSGATPGPAPSASIPSSRRRSSTTIAAPRTAPSR